MVTPLTEPSSGSEYTIQKELAPANQRIGVAEDEQIVLNKSKGPPITDQVGRGSQAAILEAFQRPIFTTSSDIHIPKKKKDLSSKSKNSKKPKILQKLNIE